MAVIEEDICIVQGYRLTEYQVFDDGFITNTFFNIRDDQGVVSGHNYDDIKTPLNLILCMWRMMI